MPFATQLGIEDFSILLQPIARRCCHAVFFRERGECCLIDLFRKSEVERDDASRLTNLLVEGGAKLTRLKGRRYSCQRQKQLR